MCVVRVYVSARVRMECEVSITLVPGGRAGGQSMWETLAFYARCSIEEGRSQETVGDCLPPAFLLPSSCLEPVLSSRPVADRHADVDLVFSPEHL